MTQWPKILRVKLYPCWTIKGILVKHSPIASSSISSTHRSGVLPLVASSLVSDVSLHTKPPTFESWTQILQFLERLKSQSQETTFTELRAKLEERWMQARKTSLGKKWWMIIQTGKIRGTLLTYAWDVQIQNQERNSEYGISKRQSIFESIICMASMLVFSRDVLLLQSNVCMHVCMHVFIFAT